MNVARLNFSHGDHATHGATVARIREAVAARPGAHVAIMLDTKGPEIRTGLLVNHAPISLVEGQALEITTDYSIEGTSSRISCSYPSLPTSVRVGSRILVADGTLVCEVTDILPAGVRVRVLCSVTLGEKKNMNLPGVIVDLPTITDKDRDDLVNFGLVHGVDMIAASFVRKASDVAHIREVLGPAGRHVKIVSKIENQEGLANFDEVLAATDGVMVARGDLGMEIPIEKVFLAQKMMIRKANLAGKPVITATQMLESMIVNARPTRAECSDVANAVLDGTDAVMLSGETANGAHPVDAVAFMARTCVEAEAVTDHAALFAAVREGTLAAAAGHRMGAAEAAASSAVKTALDMGAKAVVVVAGEAGDAARLVAKYRPACPIVAVVPADATARNAAGLLRGVRAVVVAPSSLGAASSADAAVATALEQIKSRGWASTGDCVVAVHGSSAVATEGLADSEYSFAAVRRHRLSNATPLSPATGNNILKVISIV